MGFEFSGAPPAMMRSDSPSTLQYFSPPSATASSPYASGAAGQTANLARNDISGGSITTASFSQSNRPNFSFGSPSTPGFGSANPFSRMPTLGFGSGTPSSTSSSQLCAKQAPAPGTPSMEFNESEATNPMSKALVRAVQGKRALFNKEEIAADAVVKGFFEAQQDKKSAIKTLLSELRQLRSEAPAVARFMQSMFAKLASLETPQPSAFATFVTKQEQQEDDEDKEIEVFALQDDEYEEVKCVVPGCRGPRGDGFENIDVWRAHFWVDHATFWTGLKAAKEAVGDDDSPDGTQSVSSPAEDRPRSTIPKLPREHWRTQQVVHRLAPDLLAGGHIHYPEGSKVLASLIVDMFYGNLGVHDATNLALSILGKDSREDYYELYDVITDASGDMDDADRAWVDNPGAAPMHTVKANGADKVRDMKLQKSTTTSSTVSDMTDAEPEQTVFRFLDLPPEMRNLVYRELLAPAPGYIGLSSIQRGIKRHLVRDSKCEPQILEVSKQLYKEAKGILYEENIVCVQTSTLVEHNLPIISKALLPDPVLPRITSLVLVCQTQLMGIDTPVEWIKGVHWKQLQDMTKLKQLRICMVEREDNVGQENQKKWMLEQILERVPKECELSFEARTGYEDEYVQGVIDELDEQKRVQVERRHRFAREVDGEVMAALVKGSKVEQGCKSGHARDYRFPERSIKLTPLVAAEAIDPSIVLGGA